MLQPKDILHQRLPRRLTLNLSCVVNLNDTRRNLLERCRISLRKGHNTSDNLCPVPQQLVVKRHLRVAKLHRRRRAVRRESVKAQRVFSSFRMADESLANGHAVLTYPSRRRNKAQKKSVLEKNNERGYLLCEKESHTAFNTYMNMHTTRLIRSDVKTHVANIRKKSLHSDKSGSQLTCAEDRGADFHTGPLTLQRKNSLAFEMFRLEEEAMV
ncbi:hypothetical protein HG530_014370 [Fusarium avenaceum]|nr:hypothetical protein HG530_014370 [Fusarium avenaceum]